MKINYTITGSIEIPDEVYKECAEDSDKNWEEMSTQEKIDFVIECEEENGNEAVLNAQSAGKIVIEPVL